MGILGSVRYWSEDYDTLFLVLAAALFSNHFRRGAYTSRNLALLELTAFNDWYKTTI